MIYIKLFLSLALWILWKGTADIYLCILFWSTFIAWGVGAILQTKMKGGYLILVGISSNALVTVLNGGVMPCVGAPSTFHPASPIWSISGKGRWLILADHQVLHYFSIGDIVLRVGVLLLLIETMYPLVKRNLSQRRMCAHTT